MNASEDYINDKVGTLKIKLKEMQGKLSKLHADYASLKVDHDTELLLVQKEDKEWKVSVQ